MCRLCEEFGEGMRWYLNPRFHKEIGQNQEVRDRLWEMSTGPEAQKGYVVYIKRSNDGLSSPPTEEQKKYWSGMWRLGTGPCQIVPLEDAVKIMDLAEDICVVPCLCRMMWGGKKEKVCIMWSLATKAMRESSIPWKHGYNEVEYLSADEAKNLLRKCDREGCVHWLELMTEPYTWCICNCKLPYCTALRGRLLHGIKNMAVKGHDIALVDPQKCDGCGGKPLCMTACQFGAIKYDSYNGLAVVMPSLCFGCGVCRARCPNGAITLKDKASIPAVKNLW